VAGCGQLRKAGELRIRKRVQVRRDEAPAIRFGANRIPESALRIRMQKLCCRRQALDAVIAAPKHHRVLFENERLRVLEVTLEANDEEPVHHHRWPSVFVFDQVQGPVHDVAPDGTQLPPNRDVIKAIGAWNGQGCLVVNMAPQPAGRVLNASGKTIHGIRVEMKTVQ
jgi:hypothetical protein